MVWTCGIEAKIDSGGRTRGKRNWRKIKDMWYRWERMGSLIEGRRTRGRPRKIYMDIMRIKKKKWGVTELRKISGDRRDWRRWTNTVSML